MFRGFFSRPSGVGSALNIYMFRPTHLAHACRVLVRDPGYFMARLRVILYQAIHPGRPWLTQSAIEYLKLHLRQDMTGFEFGSGRSTRWLGRRLGRLVSVEHHPSWYDWVNKRLDGVPVEYHLVADRLPEYIAPLKVFPDNSLDFVLVDGAYRDQCIALAAQKVRLGGVVVVDNADSEIIDVSPLAGFRCIQTANGVWRTDIYERLV